MLSIAYALGQGQMAQSDVPQPGPLLSFTPIILIFLVFYFLLIRPQKKKQREHEQMLSGLEKNDQVITSGGIHGTIVGVKEQSVILRVDDNVRIEVQKSAIAGFKRK